MDPQYRRTLETFCQNESIFWAASLSGGVHELEIMMVALSADLYSWKRSKELALGRQLACLKR